VTREVAAQLDGTGVLVCVDVQTGMLSYLRARRDLAAVHLVCASGDALPFRNGVFDRAYMASALGEIRNKQRALAECARVLAEGGRCAVSEPVLDPDFVSSARLSELAQNVSLLMGPRSASWRHYTQTLTKRTAPPQS